MLTNSKYQKLVKKEVSKISSKKYMEKFFNEYHDEIKRIEVLLKTERPDYKFWESSFYQSQTRILKERNNTNN